MMNSKDSAGKRDAGDGTACDEHGLEGERRDVADEGDLWVDLARVAGLPDGQPAEEEDGERGEPGDAGCKGEDPEFVGIAKIMSEDPWPRSGCHVSRLTFGLVNNKLQAVRENCGSLQHCWFRSHLKT